MKTLFISFISILLTMLILDAIWLGLMMKRFYPMHIGHILGDSPKIVPAAVFYFIFAIGVYVFVVHPALQDSSGYLHVLCMGLLFGLVTYGTYDLTNHATVKNWPLIVTVVDMTWGAILTGVVSICSVFITRYFK